jgi:hypothetical protein
MEFHARVHPFSGSELAELVAISPDDAAMQQVRVLCWSPSTHATRSARKRGCVMMSSSSRNQQGMWWGIAPTLAHKWLPRTHAQATCMLPPSPPPRNPTPIAPRLPPQGFRLQDPEVDDVIRTAKDLEAGYVEPDTSLSAEENVELLLRATRLLQLGLEVQYAEGQALLAENNDLRGDVRVRVRGQPRMTAAGGCVAVCAGVAGGATHTGAVAGCCGVC